MTPLGSPSAAAPWRHRLLATLALATLAAPAAAHAPSNAYLTLQAAGHSVQQRLDIAVRDLDRELHLDADDDGRITWGELRGRWAEVDALVQPALRIDAGSATCTPGPLAPPQLDRHSDGTHAVLQRRWDCPAAAQALTLHYSLFADSDPTHRVIVRLQAADGSEQTAVGVPGVALSMGGGAQAAEPPTGFAGFVAEGVHHILIGTDHVLFLLALLLPAVLVAGPRRPLAGVLEPRQRGAVVLAPPRMGVAGLAMLQHPAPGWLPAPRLRPVLAEVARTVTAFTLAHSLTLALAVLGVVTPPTRWVESLIALSVAVTALDNLRPFLPGARWRLTFLFGLVHGFGFAGALNDLGLGRDALAGALLGFNLGVELGQLAIVSALLPLAWWLRGTRFYQRGVLGAGSVAIALMAAVWLLERAFDLRLLPA